MENFDEFMLHKKRIEHNSTADQIKLGNGYTLAVKTNAPKMKRFVLTFVGYVYYFSTQVLSVSDMTTPIGVYRQDPSTGLYQPYNTSGSIMGVVRESDRAVIALDDPLGLNGVPIGFLAPKRKLDLEMYKNRNNFGRLLDFNQRMDITEEFIYNDDVYGETIVSFESLISEPNVIAGSNGVVEPFEVVLNERSR